MSSSTDFPARAAHSSAPPPRAATRAIGHRPRMARFLWVLLAFTALSQIVPTIAAAHVATLAHLAHPWAYGAAVLVYGVGLFLGRARSRVVDVPRAWPFLHFVDEPYFVHWCASLFASITSIFVIAVSPVVDVVRGAPITFPLDGVTATYLVGFAISVYGIIYRRRRFLTRRVEVHVEGLDDAFDGYRIVHLS